MILDTLLCLGVVTVCSLRLYRHILYFFVHYGRKTKQAARQGHEDDQRKAQQKKQQTGNDLDDLWQEAFDGPDRGSIGSAAPFAILAVTAASCAAARALSFSLIRRPPF